MKKLISNRKKGYTLVEVLVASALLGMIIGGAVKVLGTLNISEASSANQAVAINLAENAGRLWQLGLSPTEALSVMPVGTNNEFISKAIVADGSGNSIVFGTAGTTALTGSLGTLENITCTVTTSDPQGTNNRSTSVTVYRPTFR